MAGWQSRTWAACGTMLLIAVMAAAGIVEDDGAITLGAARPAPLFEARDTRGKLIRLKDLQGAYVVLEWFNHGCPFVQRHYDTGNMQKLQRKWTRKGVIWIAICSSAPGKQGHHTPDEANQLTRAKQAAPSAVILDVHGGLGRLYHAKATPHMFVINPDGLIIYQGAIDDRPMSSNPAQAKNYVDAALESAMAGEPVAVPSTRAYGCAVKY